MSATTVLTNRDDFESPVGKLALSHDLDLSHLLLEVATGDRATEASDVIISGDVDETIDGASTLTFGFNDSHRTLIRSGIFEDEKDRLRCIEVMIDGDWWRSAKLGKSGDNLSLVMEPREVDLLRRQDDPRKMSRADGTRAEFARLMIREVKSYPIAVNIPELHIKQPIEGVSAADRVRLDAYRQNNGGDANIARFDKVYPAHHIGEPGVRLTSKQVRNISEAAGLPGLAFEEIAHGESDFYPGMVQVDPGDGMVGYGLFQITPGDPPHATEGQNWGGPDSRLYQKMLDLGGRGAMRNPWKCAQMAKYMFDLSGLAPWKGTRYLTDRARAEAKAVAQGAATVSGGSEPYYKTYYFTRGQNGKREDTWTCLQRLAREVAWRCFVVRGVVYFVSEDYLIKSRPIATISEDTTGIDTIDFDLDYGKKASTATVTCRAKRWEASPGSVIVIKDCGPADGRWLVARKTRSLFSEQATVTLKRVTHKKPEPRSSLATKNNSPAYGQDSNLYGNSGGTGGVAPPLKKILSHSNGWNPGVHDGVDLICDPDSPIFAICDAKVIDVRDGGWWGKAAPSDPTIRARGDGIIQLECTINNGPFKKGMHFGYGHAEKAAVKVGDHVQAGQFIGHAGFANAWHVHFMVNSGETAQGVGDQDPWPFVAYAMRHASSGSKTDPHWTGANP